MIHPETHLCTMKRGPRPAGQPDFCFYCGVGVGSEHAASCVMRLRSVRLRVTVEYVVTRPEGWTAEQLEFHENSSSWCSNNTIKELSNNLKSGHCFCEFVTEVALVREATKEDEEAWKLDLT